MTAARVDWDGVVIEEARSMARLHVPDQQGLCFACLEFSAQLAKSPCPHSVWAAAVLAPALEVNL